MIIPIFIPSYNSPVDSDDYEPAHAYDCPCNKCVEKRKIKYKSKRYYESRTAIPKSFLFKHVMWRVITWLIGLTGAFVAISGIVFNSYFMSFIVKYNFLFQFVIPIVVGIGIIFAAIIGFDKKINQTYLWRCEDKIVLKKYKWSGEEKTWDEIIKNANVPKNYKILKPKDDWEYE